MKRSNLRIKGISDTSTLKEEIQDLVRAIVIVRDGGCILKNMSGYPNRGTEDWASSAHCWMK
jgi:hypothetical protein